MGFITDWWNSLGGPYDVEPLPPETLMSEEDVKDAKEALETAIKLAAFTDALEVAGYSREEAMTMTNTLLANTKPS